MQKINIHNSQKIFYIIIFLFICRLLALYFGKVSYIIFTNLGDTYLLPLYSRSYEFIGFIKDSGLVYVFILALFVTIKGEIRNDINISN